MSKSNTVFVTTNELLVHNYQNLDELAAATFNNLIKADHGKKNENRTKIKLKEVDLEDNIFKKGFILGRLVNFWEEVVNKDVSKVTAPIRIQHKTLIIRTNSHSLKDLFEANKTVILEKVHLTSKSDYIENLKVEIGPLEKSAQERFFGGSYPQIEKFYRSIAKFGPKLGLIGPKEIDNLWDRHIINSSLVSKYIKPGLSICDIGSGGGFPGIIIAIMNPNAKFTFIETMQKRCDWLQNQISYLHLKNAKVINARSSEINDVQFDIITSRAVAPLKKLIPQTVHLLKYGGAFIALKGQKIQEEIDEAASILSKYNFSNIRVETVLPNEISEDKSLDCQGVSSATVFIAEKATTAKRRL